MSTAGEAFDREQIIRLLKPGTIRAEIIAELGPPLVEELNISGETLMTWVALQEGVLFFKRMEGQSLVIRLNEQGILLDFSIQGTLEPKK